MSYGWLCWSSFQSSPQPSHTPFIFMCLRLIELDSTILNSLEYQIAGTLRSAHGHSIHLLLAISNRANQSFCCRICFASKSQHSVAICLASSWELLVWCVKLVTVRLVCAMPSGLKFLMGRQSSVKRLAARWGVDENNQNPF